MKSRNDTLAELKRCRDDIEKLRIEIDTGSKNLPNLPPELASLNKFPRIFAIRNNRGEWKLASSRLDEDAGDERRVGECEAIVTRARIALGYASDNDLLDRLLVHLKQKASGTISLLQCYLDVGFARVRRSFLTPTGFVIGRCEDALEEWLCFVISQIAEKQQTKGTKKAKVDGSQIRAYRELLDGARRSWLTR
jgi:hypothetical protein